MRARIGLTMSHAAVPNTSSFENLLAQLGDSGRDFERIAKWFLEHDPDYAAQLRRVWLWKDWPGRWGIDKGIDLIAETHDGALIAIQAKHYDEQHWISKRDIDTFLSESGRAAIKERLLIATTDRVASTALEVMSAQEKPVSRCLRSRLAGALVQWPASPDDLDSGHRHPAKTPRPDQEEALRAIGTGLELHDRGKVIMACGTGKTLIALWAAERAESELTLVLVPSLWLLRQTAQEWAASAQLPPRTLKVCSERGGSEEDTPALIDVADIGPGVTTDPAAIRTFLNGAGPRVVFATYQSSPQIAKAMAHDCAATFDLAICDEAHWCAGLAGKGNKTILHEDKIRVRKRLFFTATPTIYPPHEIVRVARRRMTVVSMADTKMFGPELYRLSFADAIDRGLLCPYQVVVMPVSDQEVQELIEQRNIVTTDGGDTRIDAYSLATQIACLRAMRDFGCRRMVTFHPRIERSKVFSRQLQQAVDLLPAADRPTDKVWAEHIDGAGMPRSKRNQLLATFAQENDGTHRLLSNVKLLSEGVDVPGIDAITMIDTTRGPAQVIQIVGRAVRRYPGKTVGTIVLPVLVAEGQDPREALARSEHRPIMNLLAALRATDPDIERSVDELWVQIDPDAPDAPARRRFVLAIPTEVGTEFADAVNVMLVDALAPSQRNMLPAAEPGSGHSRSPARSATIRFDERQEAFDPNPIETGLYALIYHHRWHGGAAPLGSIPTQILWYSQPYEIGRWWARVRQAWDTPAVTEELKYELADLVSWLAIDEVRYAAIRGDLRRRTTVDLDLHLDAWIADIHSSAREELQELAAAGDIGPRSYLVTKRLCSAFAGHGMPESERARVVCKALLIAGDECRRRARPKYFAQGFMEALEVLAPKKGATPAPPESESATEQHTAGWLTAEPFFEEARRARGLASGDASTRGTGKGLRSRTAVSSRRSG